MKYLDPKNDLTFKKIFGEHPHLLISFLNAMLPLNGNTIESIEYLTGEMIPELPGLKHSIVDVRCKEKETGRLFIVEMQMYWTNAFKQRMLFNASKAYVQQIKKKGKYTALEPVYGLSLVNEDFETGKGFEKIFYHHYRMIHTECSEKHIEGLELIFVELPKFQAQNFTEKRLQYLWLKFLTEIGEDTKDIPKELTENKEIKEAIDLMEVSGFNENELLHYDKYWDGVRVETTTKEESFVKGEQIGIAKGEQIGIAKGEQIGLYKSILNALRKGNDINVVADFLGMEIELVQRLKILLDKYGDNAEKRLNEL